MPQETLRDQLGALRQVAGDNEETAFHFGIRFSIYLPKNYFENIPARFVNRINFEKYNSAKNKLS